MVARLYTRLQRKGFLRRDCLRLVNQDRNVFGALLLDMGHGDAMITGTTRHFRQSLDQVRLVLDPAEGHLPFGVHVLVGRSSRSEEHTSELQSLMRSSYAVFCL